jgi:hypothetical protein
MNDLVLAAEATLAAMRAHSEECRKNSGTPLDEWACTTRLFREAGNSSSGVLYLPGADEEVSLYHCWVDSNGKASVSHVPVNERLLSAARTFLSDSNLRLHSCECGFEVLSEYGDYECPACSRRPNLPPERG